MLIKVAYDRIMTINMSIFVMGEKSKFYFKGAILSS